MDNYKDFDLIIDVRTPLEYKHSHIPHAYNMPVLEDEQFQKIGTLYHQNMLQANLLGASLACQNIAKFLQKVASRESHIPLQHKYKILIYCARGGKRSQALYEVLKNLNFQVTKLQGGYKSYRAFVLETLEKPVQFITLSGPTGCGKSEILEALKEQCIHLESLAHHYGSSFGDIATKELGPQPSQKMFENLIAHEIHTKPQPLFIEAESKRLGNLIVPRKIFECYQNAPKVFVNASLQSRIERIIKLYHPIPAAQFSKAMQKIQSYMNKETFDTIHRAFELGDLKQSTKLLITQYYDRVYKKSNFSYELHHTNLKDSIDFLQRLREKFSTPPTKH
ncbi:ATP /GTP binding protein [Helicobacter mustelae]|uniref:tRNA 2-selenouridine(34) synthase MnmH n=1 Tax=Helicobacter mustelae TaxID=217 RepID=UPI000E053FE9|nr:tRNA 2-selenouridine(34) synthase MnmH [Helicobacter mustelae]STP12273.1 ATP /GTP binding protein [Helicobacter mustelae]